LTGTSKRGNEPSGSINCGEFRDKLQTGWVLKKVSAAINKFLIEGDVKLKMIHVSYTLIGKRQLFSVPYESLFIRKCPNALYIRAEHCINFAFSPFI